MKTCETPYHCQVQLFTNRCDACVTKLYNENMAEIAAAKLTGGHKSKYTTLFASMLRTELRNRGLSVGDV